MLLTEIQDTGHKQGRGQACKLRGQKKSIKIVWFRSLLGAYCREACLLYVVPEALESLRKGLPECLSAQMVCRCTGNTPHWGLAGERGLCTCGTRQDSGRGPEAHAVTMCSKVCYLPHPAAPSYVSSDINSSTEVLLTQDYRNSLLIFRKLLMSVQS